MMTNKELRKLRQERHAAIMNHKSLNDALDILDKAGYQVVKLKGGTGIAERSIINNSVKTDEPVAIDSGYLITRRNKEIQDQEETCTLWHKKYGYFSGFNNAGKPLYGMEVRFSKKIATQIQEIVANLSLMIPSVKLENQEKATTFYNGYPLDINDAKWFTSNYIQSLQRASSNLSYSYFHTLDLGGGVRTVEEIEKINIEKKKIKSGGKS